VFVFEHVYVRIYDMNKKKKVLVALSGGVDSSVSAALLLEQGYHVEGVFIKTWSVPWLPCTWREERRDAMRVAAQLHIPFHTIDLSFEYERDVVQYLINEYAQGRIPNPDVMCNKFIKFGGLFDWAMSNGFDYVATGHYARVKKVLEKNNTSVSYELLQGVDTDKDQTYFLWTLTQEHLARILFPIGDFKKMRVRKMAKDFNLLTAEKKDSQGICFLGKVDMKEFLSHYIQSKQGDVLSVEGDVIGKHDGAVFYTCGQRHGFTVFQKTPNAIPLYVVKKDTQANTITVASDVPHNLLEKNKRITLIDMNWIMKRPVITCTARLRYRQKLFPVNLVDVTRATCTVLPHKEQLYVQSGQSVVLYEGDVCVGGGIIS